MNTNFCCALFVGLFILPFFSCNTHKEALLIWQPNRTVLKSDFWGTGEASKYGGAISSKIHYHKTATGQWQVYSAMNRDYSFKKYLNKFGLRHEQGHFDISEYHARLFRKDIAENKLKPLSDSFKIAYITYSKALDKMQTAYDRATHTAIGKEVQLKWLHTIDSLLKSLDAYSNINIQ